MLKNYNYMGMSDNIISTTRYTEDKVSYYVYNKNIQGSTTNVVNQAGDSVLGYTYDDFGNPVEYKLSEVVNEITYTGAIYDHSTGLYYMNARYYDASTGRFISQDSYRGELLEPGTWHLYTYCANNPINYSDPSGHFALPWLIPVAVDVVISVGAKVVAGAIAVGVVGNTAKKYRESKRDSVRNDPLPQPGPAPDYNSKAKSKSNSKLKSKSSTKIQVKESGKAQRQKKKLSPEAKKGYDNAIKGLKNGKKGLNDHALKGPRNGQRAIDIPGTGKGRGGGRIIYTIGNGVVNIIEIITGHKY